MFYFPLCSLEICHDRLLFHVSARHHYRNYNSIYPVQNRRKQSDTCPVDRIADIKLQAPIQLQSMYAEDKDYLTKAGTVIFIASILMWAILNLVLMDM